MPTRNFLLAYPIVFTLLLSTILVACGGWTVEAPAEQEAAD